MPSMTTLTTGSAAAPAAVAPTMRAAALSRRVVAGLSGLAPLLDLGLRLIVAEAFFKSGLTKIAS